MHWIVDLSDLHKYAPCTGDILVHHHALEFLIYPIVKMETQFLAFENCLIECQPRLFRIPKSKSSATIN